MRVRKSGAETRRPNGAPRTEEDGRDLVASEEEDLHEADALREQARRDPGVDPDHGGDREKQRALPRRPRERMAERLPRALEEARESSSR